MIKSLNKSDILVTPFDVQKNWEADNSNPSDLILWELNASTGPVSATYIDYGDNSSNYPVTNSNCTLALQQQESEFVTYQKGIMNNAILYPTSSFNPIPSIQNPINIDSTYMNIIYEENKHLFYNSYNNFTKTFGMENADLSTTNRTLTSEMDVFTVPPSKFGEKIIPKSVNITDKSFGKPYTIIDDGNCNLIFSGSVFSTIQFDDYLHSRRDSLNAVLSSFDNETGSIQYCSITTQSLGDNAITKVSSSILHISPSGGVAPYEVTWYIAGYYRDNWKLNSTSGTENYLTYNLSIVDTTNLYFDNTYVVCKVVDIEDTTVYSNLIYLKFGNANPITTTIPTTPIDILPPVIVFPPAAPDTNTILHLTNTGESKILVNNAYIDNRYVLYNYTPNDIVANSIGGIPSGISPYSSSYIGNKGDEWVTPTFNVAGWISPIYPDVTQYTNKYAGTFIYRTYFDTITADGIPFSPDSNFSLEGLWAADNTASIFINGINTNNSLIPIDSTDNTTFTNKHTFAITGGFIAGRNYLEFRIDNTYISSALENPVGLYVEFNKDNKLFKTYSPPVITNPTINGQVSPQTINIGNSAIFSATVSGDQPMLYQWYKDGLAINNVVSNPYALTMAQLSSAGSYILYASNDFGTAISTPIVLNVNSPVPVIVPPSITQQPTYQIISGTTLQITMTATGTAPLTYQWYLNGTPITNSNGNSNILIVYNYNNGNYQVRVSNSAGIVLSNTLYIENLIPTIYPPTITENLSYSVYRTAGPNPHDMNLSYRQHIRFIVGAVHGEWLLRYELLFNGMTIQTVNIPHDRCVFNIYDFTYQNNGNYQVRVSNSAGTVLSNIIDFEWLD